MSDAIPALHEVDPERYHNVCATTDEATCSVLERLAEAMFGDEEEFDAACLIVGALTGTLRYALSGASAADVGDLRKLIDRTLDETIPQIVMDLRSEGRPAGNA